MKTPTRKTLIAIACVLALAILIVLPALGRGGWSGAVELFGYCAVGMAVTANQVTKRQSGERGNYPVAASTNIYEGTLVFENSSGYADDDTGSGANRFGGVAIQQKDNSSGSNGDLSVECWRKGIFPLVGTGFAQTSVGKPVFATDNYTVSISPAASNAVLIGICVGYVSSTVILVDIITDGSFGISGVAGGYKIARGQHTTVDENDTVVTGLTTVVAAVAQLDSDPVDGAMHVTSSIGDQAGAPAAGSILIKTWKSTDADASLVAASTFSKLVNWIAIGV